MVDWGFPVGETSASIYFRLRDSTTGLAKTGLVFDSAGANASYVLKQGLRVAITLVTLAAADTAYASGGFKEVDATNMKGLYRLDLPNAVIAARSFALVSLEFDGVIEETALVEVGAHAVWEEILTGAAHNTPTSAGKRLRAIDAAFEVASGTAQGGTASSITLAAGESAIDDIFKGDRVIIVGGTGVGEHAIITAYDGGTKIALTTPNWVTTPIGADSEYEIVPASVNLETVDGTPQTAGDLAALLVGLNDISVVDIFTTQLADVYAANGVAPTAQQAWMAMHQMLMAFAISGTSISVKKLDGAAEAFVVTLDDADDPVQAIRS